MTEISAARDESPAAGRADESAPADAGASPGSGGAADGVAGAPRAPGPPANGAWSGTRWKILVGFAVISVLVAVGIVLRELAETIESPHMVDLRIYLGAARAYGSRSIYDYADPLLNLGSTYPPIASIFFVPLTWITPRKAEIVWTIVNFVCLFAVGVLIARRHLRVELREAVVLAAVVLAPLLCLRPVFKTLGLGQVNIVLWTIVLFDVFAIQRRRALGGVGIGVATALKLVPGIFIVLLLTARRWAAAACATATVLALSALAWVLDPSDSKTYWTRLLWQSERVGPVADAQNNSLRFLFANTTLVERAQVVLWLLCAAAIAGIGLWRAAAAFRRGSVLYATLVTGCVAALVSPISWTHHLVFLPLVILFLPRTPWKPLGWALVVACAFFLWDPVGVGYSLLTSSMRAWFMVLIVVGVIGTDRPSHMLFPPRPHVPGTDDGRDDEPSWERVTGWERALGWWRARQGRGRRSADPAAAA